MAGRTIPIHSASVVHAPTAVISEGIAFTTLPPLSLYIHLPWCVRKCPYCDFNSHEARGDLPFDTYVDALIADVEAALPMIWGRPVVSVFFGGGTPSLFPAAAIGRLLDALRARLKILPGSEVTLEANPGAVDEAKFADLAAAGINRVSIGVQSFDDAMLARLGRIHAGDDATRAVDAALRHFASVNVDLMHALPQQTPQQAMADVQRAVALGVPHISAYQLTLEPNTAFAACPPEHLPDADTAADIAEAVESTLATAGLEHYETSAHARAGERCRHNLNYWTFGDYLGIGAGAHGKLSLPDRIVRQSRLKHPKAYLERAAAGESTLEASTDVSPADLPFEFAINAMRLTEGFAPSLYAQHTGRPVGELIAGLTRARDQGLVDVTAHHVGPTPLGQRHLNALLETLLPDLSASSA